MHPLETAPTLGKRGGDALLGSGAGAPPVRLPGRREVRRVERAELLLGRATEHLQRAGVAVHEPARGEQHDGVVGALEDGPKPPLAVAESRLRQLALGDVLHRPLEAHHLTLLVPQRAGVEVEPDRPAVGAGEPHLEVAHDTLAVQGLAPEGRLAGVHEEVLSPCGQQRLAARAAEDLDRCRVDVQDHTFGGRAVQTDRHAVEKRTMARLGAPQLSCAPLHQALETLLVLQVVLPGRPAAAHLLHDSVHEQEPLILGAHLPTGVPQMDYLAVGPTQVKLRHVAGGAALEPGKRPTVVGKELPERQRQDHLPVRVAAQPHEAVVHRQQPTRGFGSVQPEGHRIEGRHPRRSLPRAISRRGRAVHLVIIHARLPAPGAARRCT